ncbi:hypothetical protein GPECTOR_6g479 [Gonium pectorale]|uniref:Uncharacterized protein n=1 Tax=Gonium pectorale TaxID=33097 RepID=A0A150GUY1_GONPE|nr:hypothetical protein GPECTOR_6g479 [Gonium pectorale]|eukprot:KXZ53563.1 hypothetical protein GPECTOR_6g479 [Gonium pectorale]
MASAQAGTEARRELDRFYRPPPTWGCETGLPPGAFHVVVATYAPEPTSLIPWIWNLGLTGARIWIYHRLASDDPRLAAAAATFAAFEPYPCGSAVLLQQLLPNKGREAAVYLAHIVRQYGNLPDGLALVHDHGPAARHSLCGPFFRRLRGYYKGIAVQRRRKGQQPAATAAAAASNATAAGAVAEAAVAAAAGPGAGVAVPAASRRSLRAGGGRRRRRGDGEGGDSGELLTAFADMAVSLSSGCQWAWGAVETVRSATSSSRSLDYPEGAARRTTGETFAALGRILQEHGFAQRKAPGNFKSCCASLLLRPAHVLRWPLSMYEQMLSYTLDERNTYHASLAVSHHGWALWGGSEVGPSDLLRYFEVDLALLHIRGCPGWRLVRAAAAAAAAKQG